MSRMMQQIANRLLPSSSFDAIRQFARLSRDIPYETKILWNVVPYAGYAYGLLHACRQAQKLGISHVSALELGVAGGNGLRALERHSKKVEQITGVSISTVGFDTGEGLLQPVDHRDMPYYFSPGDYRMREDRLREVLTRSRLIIGDVSCHFNAFLEGSELHPIAFVAFDMDYYHPTKFVLDCIAKHDPSLFLPRPYFYFDNTVGTAETLYNEFCGELLAIDEFNKENDSQKIAQDRSLKAHNLNFIWYNKMYVLHQFGHPLYSRNIGKPRADALSLKEAKRDI